MLSISKQLDKVLQHDINLISEGTNKITFCFNYSIEKLLINKNTDLKFHLTLISDNYGQGDIAISFDTHQIIQLFEVLEKLKKMNVF